MTYNSKTKKIAAKRYSGLKQRFLDDEFPKWEKENFIKWYQAQSNSCFYCKLHQRKLYQFYKLTKSKRYGTRGRTLEIDRKKDTSYSEDNCCFCCYWCNNAKSDVFSEEQFLKIAEKINEVILNHLTCNAIWDVLKSNYPTGLSNSDYDDIVVVIKKYDSNLSLAELAHGDDLLDKIKNFYDGYEEECFDLIEKFQRVLLDRTCEKSILED